MEYAVYTQSLTLSIIRRIVIFDIFKQLLYIIQPIHIKVSTVGIVIFK